MAQCLAPPWQIRNDVAWLRLFELCVYGADDRAAPRDILFTCWEQTFLGAAKSGAAAIGDRKAYRGAIGSKLNGLCEDKRFGRKRTKLTL